MKYAERQRRGSQLGVTVHGLLVIQCHCSCSISCDSMALIIFACDDNNLPQSVVFVYRICSSSDGRTPANIEAVYAILCLCDVSFHDMQSTVSVLQHCTAHRREQPTAGVHRPRIGEKHPEVDNTFNSSGAAITPHQTHVFEPQSPTTWRRSSSTGCRLHRR